MLQVWYPRLKQPLGENLQVTAFNSLGQNLVKGQGLKRKEGKSEACLRKFIHLKFTGILYP